MNKIKQILKDIQMAYDRFWYGMDEMMWNNSEEFIAVLRQEKANEALENRGLTIKEQDIMEHIALGMGSYLEMSSGFYPYNDPEYKRLEKEYKTAEKLIAENYKTIWRD